jgi:uncharacterized protein (TIGR03437 family)
LLKVRVFGLAIVFAAVAFSQPIIQPAQMKIGAAVGTNTPVTETAYLVAAGSFGQNLDYTLSIRYLSSQQGWLSATPLSGKTPVKFTVAADPTNLPAGTYSALVYATVGPTLAATWTDVSFIVAPATSNPAGLAASPTALAFVPPSAAPPAPQTITVLNSPGTTGTVGFSVFANPTDWLTVGQGIQTTPGSVTVQPLLSGLSAGVHTGTVTITSTSGKSTVVPVSLMVPNAAAGVLLTLTPAQRSLVFNFQLNTTLNPSQTVFVSTDAVASSFTATASDSWIRLAPDSTTAPASTTQSFAPGLFYVTVDPTGLTAGTYTGKVTLSASGASPVDIPVTLGVSSSPVLNASPSFIALDAASGLLSSNLAVTGSAAFFFTATVTAPWLSVTPSSAAASTFVDNLTVTANTAGLVAGTYNASIILTGASGSPVQNIPVQLRISGGTGSTTSLTAAPGALTFTGTSTSVVPVQFVQASADTAGAHVVAAATSDSGWLSIDPQFGTSPLVSKVSVNSAVPGGSYTGQLVFTSLETGDQATIPVTFKVTARVLTVAPAILQFTQQTAGTPLQPQSVQVTANVPSTFRIVSQPAWIKVAAPATLATPSQLTVSVDPTGMSPGSYQDSILLSGPSDVAIPVSLILAAPAPPGVTPAAINFSYQLGSPPPPGQAIQVINPSGTVTYTAAASTVSGIPWLTLAPNSGSTPGSISVTVAVAQLVPGQHSGTITVTVQNAAPVTVAVTLTVTGVTVQVQRVLNGATLAPASVAPGEILTLTGFGLGPDTAAVAQASAAGAFGTQLAGTQVLFDGIPAPLLMVQAQQINLIAPYALYGRPTASLQVQSGSAYSLPISVQVAGAAPGIFTAGSSGRGAAAALNGDSTLNSALNPAARGNVIVLYLTGEGQTDPPGQDGRLISTDLRKPLLPVTATISGVSADVLYAGSASTLVSGLCQVNLRIPDSIPTGTQPVEIQVGGIPSQNGVTIEVK